MIAQWQVLMFFVALQAVFAAATMGGGINLTDFLEHRQRRSLIFENGGQIKLVIGLAMPVVLGDKVPWRSMVHSINLHGGHYPIPTTPLYPWDKWEDTFARSLKQMRLDFDRMGSYETDESRLFVYAALESYMSRQCGHDNGRACLLRSICENAQVAQHVGVFAEILSIILTPGRESLDAGYGEAYAAGKSGAACLQMYAECPAGANLLDQYLDEL